MLVVEAAQMPGRRVTVIAALAATGLACAFSLVLMGLAWPRAVPDNWGFRGFWLLQAVLFAVPGAVVMWRRAQRYGLVLLAAGFVWALFGLMQEYLNYAFVLPAGELPLALPTAWVFSWYWVLCLAPLLMVVVLFPDGRYPSRRWRSFPWALLAVMAVGVPAYALRPGPLENAWTVINPWPAPAAFEPLVGAGVAAFNVGVALSVLVAAAAPVVRFQRSNGEARRQIKWFAYAGSIVAVAMTINLAANDSKPTQILATVAMLGLPIAVGVAILRHGLYDVDVLINRTLVYGTLTAVLAVTYFAAVVLLQTILSPLTSGSELAVAASTLTVVALVQPLRRRMQDTVDRRFYRSRYDAARTLETFTARLRNEMDLQQVRTDILEVVGRTVTPKHASLWLRRK